MNKKLLVIIILLVTLFFVWQFSGNEEKKVLIQKEMKDTVIDINSMGIDVEKPGENKINMPITDAESRVTKKPFGIKITPSTSPVQSERFSGIHTGTDFEIFPEELNKEIKIFAICGGKIIQKNRISGYGGFIIQQCSIDGGPVTVLYGHLSIGRSNINVGDETQWGEEIAVLGSDKSEDTDGERKHLHLGIHKGIRIDLRGYVNMEKELDQWISAEDYLKLKND